MALLAATSSALRETQTRQIDHSIPTIVIAFMGSIAIIVVGLLFAPAEQWHAVPTGDVAQLAVAAVFVGIATYLMAIAFRGVDLSVVAPFRYSYLLTSALAGYLVFSEVPDAWSVAGAVLIVGSGLYALHREAVRRRELHQQGDSGGLGLLAICSCRLLLLPTERLERILLEDILAVVDLFVHLLRRLAPLACPGTTSRSRGTPRSARWRCIAGP